METDEARPTLRGAWVHFAVLVLLAATVQFLILLRSDSTAGGWPSAASRVPEFLFGALPVILAVSVGMLPFTRPGFRHAVWLVIAVTLVMIVIDLAGTRGPLAFGERLGVVSGQYVASPRMVDFTGLSLVETAAAFLRGDLVIPTEQASRWEAGHPLILASLAVQKAGHLLLPVLLVGVVLGVQAWISEHVTFHRPVDERVARITVAWILAPTTYFLVLSWAQEIRVNVLLQSTPLPSILLPFVAVGVVGAVGWITSWRAFRWMA